MGKEKELLHKHDTPARMEKPAARAPAVLPPSPRALVQRGAGNAAFQRAVIARKAAGGSGPVKSGIPVSQPGDRAEREADAAAEKVMCAPSSASPTPPTSPPTASRPANLPDTVQSALASGGRPLDPTSRAFFEPRFGADLSGVRVHTGAEADRSTRDLNANAFTAAENIVFRQDHEDVHSPTGQQLLAHELAHVIQQRAGFTPMLARDTTDPPKPLAERAKTVFAGATESTLNRMLSVLLNSNEATDERFVTVLQEQVSAALAQEPDGSILIEPLKPHIQAIKDVKADLPGSDITYLGAVELLAHFAGVPREANMPTRVAFSTGYFIRLASGAIGLYLTQNAFPQPDMAQFGTPDYLANYLGSIVSNWGDPYGILELELEATIDELVTRRKDFETQASPAARAQIGQQIGELSRRVILLSQAIQPLRDILDRGDTLQPTAQKSVLEDQLGRVDDQINTIRWLAQKEKDTLSAPGVDNRLEALTMRSFSVPRPMGNTLGTTINPGEAFPKAADKANLQMLGELANRVSDQSSRARGLRNEIIPASPSYSMEEFRKIYHNWFAFFSPQERQHNPLYQMMNTLISTLNQAYSMAGAEGGIGRAMVMHLFQTYVAMSIGSPNTQFASNISGYEIKRQEALGGDVNSPNYQYGELYTGRQAGVTDPSAAALSGANSTLGTGGEAANREALLGREVSRSLEGFQKLRVAQAGGQPEVEKEAIKQGLVGPGNASGPYTLISNPQAQMGWNYLVNFGEPDPMLQFPPGHEQKTMPPEVARYLLARSQLLASLQKEHQPTLNGQAFGGEKSLEQTQGTFTERYTEGAPDTAVAPQAAADRGRIGRARQEAGVGPNGRGMPMETAVTELINDLEKYMDGFFASRTSQAERITAVLLIGTTEFEVAQKYVEHFTAANIAKSMGILIAIVGAIKAMRYIPRIGEVLSSAASQLLHQMGIRMGVSMVIALVDWFYLAGEVGNFIKARTMGYFARDLASEFGEFIVTSILGGVLGFGEAAFQTIRAPKPPQTVRELVTQLDPMLRDPVNRRLFIDTVKREIAMREPNALNQGVSDPDIEYLRAIRSELEGVSSPDTPPQAGDLELPTMSRRQRAEEDARRAGISRDALETNLNTPVASHSTPDGAHVVNVNQAGEVTRCSPDCPLLRLVEKPALEKRPDLNQRLETIEKMADRAVETHNQPLADQAAENAALLEPQIRAAGGQPGQDWVSPLSTRNPARYQELLKLRGSNTPVPSNPSENWTGALEAEFRGYPKAETDYYWTLDKNGTLRYVRKEIVAPTGEVRPPRFYNEANGAFEDLPEAIIHAKPTEIDTLKIPNENRDYFNRNLRERKAALEDRDRLDAIAEKRKLTPQEEAELAKAKTRAQEASRRMGERAGRIYIETKYKGKGAELLHPSPRSPSRSGEFDQIWRIPGAGKNGKDLYIVIEAKGGGSQRGTRQTVMGEVAQQGTSAYFNDIVTLMTNRGEALAVDLQAARAEGRVQYLEVRAPIGTSDGRDVANPIKISDYNL